MTQSSLHADAFYSEIARTNPIWTLRDSEGIPAPMGDDGRRAMPFWSSKNRVEIVIATVPAYSSFEVMEIALSDFLERWVPGLTRDGLLLGLNWSGARATGYDIEPAEFLRHFQQQKV